MGTFVGHILPGAGFVLLGLWHLYNTVGGHIAWSPRQVITTRTWYPVLGVMSHQLVRYAELYAIMLGSCISIAAELFICPAAHQPWAADWSIPTNHLNNFEHSTISLFVLTYAALALVSDVTELKVPHGWFHALAAIVLSQELLLFHFHSADHMGLEGHYHWLLQLPIAVGILCLVAEIAAPSLPVFAILRSFSFVFQGTWLIQIGFVLWTPSLLPKDCAMVATTHTVQCATVAATQHAKAIANLQFSWHLAAIVVFTGALLSLLSALQTHGHQLPIISAHSTAYQAQPRFTITDDQDDRNLEHGRSREMQPLFSDIDLE